MQPEDYRAAVERYRDMVWRGALNGTRHTQDAEDVTQEVFLRLFTTRKPFQGEAHLKHWLLRATVNRCRSLMASPWHARRAALEPDEAAPDPAAQLGGGSGTCTTRCAPCRPRPGWRCTCTILKGCPPGRWPGCSTVPRPP